MVDREQLSLRQAVAWLGDPITVRSATRLVELAHPDGDARAVDNGSVRMAGRRVDQTGLAALARALADSLVVDRYRSKIVAVPGSDCLWWTGAISGRGHGRFWYGTGTGDHRAPLRLRARARGERLG